MNRLRHLSITARITIGSLLVAALLGIMAVGVLRVTVASILQNATVSELVSDLSAPTAAIEAGALQRFKLHAVGEQLAVLDPGGHLIASTLSNELSQGVADYFTRPSDKPFTVTVGANEYTMLLNTVTTTDGNFRVLAIRNNQTTNLILERLTIALLIGTAVVILAFGVASSLLARAALRPVRRMQRQADHIAGTEDFLHSDTQELLSTGTAKDEIFALAATLNGLISRLRASAERERQMVSDASHELRTPLAVLRGQLELAELSVGNPDALLADIRSSHATALRLGELANNLLELSKIQAAPKRGRILWRPLLDEFTDAVDRARLLANRDDDLLSITIDFEYEPSQRPPTGVAVGLSPTDIQRILDNLLGNAITAIRSAAHHEIAEQASIVTTLDLGKDYVVLSVQDSGPGMPAEFLPVALDRFTRADNARTSRSVGGAGLGLAIVAGLARAAGGSVTIANIEPHGLLVTVTLPLFTESRAQPQTVS